MATEAPQPVTTRLRAQVQAAGANAVARPDGRVMRRPGQGGVVTGIALGDRALGRDGDHVEPGASLGHPDPDAERALRLLACVGNLVTVLDGAAAGARGMVYGKHGAVLAMFAPDALSRLAPGDWVAIEAVGVGLSDPAFPQVALRSCSPDLYAAIARAGGDRTLHVAVAAVLPAIAAAAGIGMPSAMFNMDLNTAAGPVADLARDLRFGDVVAVLDQDHRFGRQYRKGWVMAGIVSHGTALGGGHGIGLMTLLTGPADQVTFLPTADACLPQVLTLPWQDC